MLHRPDAIVPIGNGWWTSGGNIVAIQRASTKAWPVGVGVKDASELKDDLVDACGNLKRGTTMFAKILRIVAKWYGNPDSAEVFPQIFEGTVYAWKTGGFEAKACFRPTIQVELPPIRKSRTRRSKTALPRQLMRRKTR
jgi:hypothetical protein